MTSGFDYLATASRLAGYFERQEQLEGQRWTPGKLAANLWIGALQRPAVPLSLLIEIDQLILEGIGDTSTAWEELRLAYHAWREGR